MIERMRTLAALVPLAVVACNQPPVVEIVAPAPDLLVTDHGSIVVQVLATDENLARLELLLDGQPADAFFDPATLPEDGECDDGCDLNLAWNAREAREGTHTITVIATDELDETDAADQVITFEDVPSATLTPNVVDQLGVGTLDVTVAVLDRGELTTELRIDGVVQPATLDGDCRYGCQIALPWDTTGLEGEHTIDFVVTDAGDRSATATQTFALGDIPYATAIEITGEQDNIGFGDLEVEIHLADADTGAFLGCSGQDHGMEHVDESNERYTVLAHFVDLTGARLTAAALAGRNLEISVMEDDNYPCPGQLDLIADDHVGTSAPVAAADLAGLAPMMFGNVLDLEMSSGRPYDR